MVAVIIRILIAIAPALWAALLVLQNHIAYAGPKILLALAPPLIWMLIFLLEDREKPEPKKVLAEAFAVGALSAVALGSVIYYLVYVFKPAHPEIPLWIKDFFSTDQTTELKLSVFFHAFVEEIFKFTAIWLVFRKSKFLNEPVDGMIFLITGAMGFAAIENLLLIFLSPDPLGLMTFRFFGAVLLHALMAGTVGYYWMRKKLLIGILLAGLIHGLFNTLILNFANGVIYGTWLLIIVAFFILRDFAILKRYGSR